MDIQGLDSNKFKAQQNKAQKQSEESHHFMSVLGQKSAEVLQQRIAATQDVRKQALRRDKFLVENGDSMDAETVAEELFESKKKKLAQKVQSVLRAQQQNLGL